MILTCEVYGYPRDSSPPKWSSPGRDLTTCKFNTNLSNADKLLSNSSVSSEESVVLQLKITDITPADEGEYTCSVNGESETLTISPGKCRVYVPYKRLMPKYSQ